jgi:hypothetical protein
MPGIRPLFTLERHKTMCIHAPSCLLGLGGGPRLSTHASHITTKLYDRTSDQITLDELERILI